MNLDLMRELSTKTDSKIVLLVLDGLGGLPLTPDGQTELEAANTPNLDAAAAESDLGLSRPVAAGVTPGSGPGHLGLFGYNIASVDQDLPSSAAGDVSKVEQRVIKTAELGLTSGNVRETASIAQVIAERAGGNVMSSQLDRSDGRVSAYLTLDVPSSEFEATLEELRGLGESVTTDAVQGQDVTEEFVDLESRERNLLAAEESLLRTGRSRRTGSLRVAPDEATWRRTRPSCVAIRRSLSGRRG